MSTIPSAASKLPALLEPLASWAAKRYRAAVGSQLVKYGLRYDDLYDPLLNQDVGAALDRLPLEEVDARNQRLKRAMDLSLKRDYLSPEMQGAQTPFMFYAKDAIATIEAENAEKAALGTGKSYDRQIP